MLDTQELLPFDLFQQIVLWLSISMRSHRKGCHFLENNPVLLHAESDRELERLVIAHAEDPIEMKQQLHDHLELLRDARKRGGTAQAMREAYINAYGGFCLDLPAWLAEIEQHRLFLLRMRRPERTNKTQVNLLHHCLARAEHAEPMAPEIIGELLNELGSVLTQSTHYYNQHARLQDLEEAMRCHKAALKIFTLKQYPLQAARTAFCLGLAYQCYGTTTGSLEAIEYAITSNEVALYIYTREHYPEQWAMLQTYLGNGYARRSIDEPAENLARAIACHEAALEVVSPTSAPNVWAQAQVHLGDAYWQRGLEANDMQRAMSCYRAALQVYTIQTHAKEWADIHTRLAAIYQSNVEEEGEQRDKHLRCAIVCCEGALQVYSPDAFPVEFAATQVYLGYLHRIRPAGDRLANLKQAHKCYQSALQIFTQRAFPTECHKVQLALADTEVEIQIEEQMQRSQAVTFASTRV